MPIRPFIVPDVNVMVSGTTISQMPATPPIQVMQAWRAREIELATSEPILQDLERVLSYPRVQKFTHMSQQEVVRYVSDLRGSAQLVPGTTEVQVSPDPDDNKLFACAVEAGADYIVSGDKKDVLSIGEYEGVKTISPTDFVRDVLIGAKAA